MFSPIIKRLTIDYVLSIILLGIGIVQTIYPEKAFMFGRGMK